MPVFKSFSKIYCIYSLCDTSLKAPSKWSIALTKLTKKYSPDQRQNRVGVVQLWFQRMAGCDSTSSSPVFMVSL